MHVFRQQYGVLSEQEDSRPDGLCDMRPFWIIKDYIIFMQFHIQVHIYIITTGSFHFVPSGLDL